MNDQKDVLLQRLNALVVARPLFFIPLLGLFVLLNFNALQNTPDIYVLYFLMGATGGLTLLYLALISWIQSFQKFVIGQIAGDLFLMTLLLGITGNVESPFSILYIANIVLSAFFFPERGGVLTATTSILLLGATVFFTKDLISSEAALFSGGILLPRQETLYRLLLHVMAFYATGVASGGFFRKMQEKEAGFTRLRRLHEDIVRNIPSGLVTTDPAGRITLFNSAASEIMGITAEEALGVIWWELFQWKELQQHYQLLIVSRVPQRFEGGLTKKNGEPCVMGVTLSSLCNDQGEITGMIGVFQDLTGIKRLEEEMDQKRRLAAIGEVAAGMAHEIRNPLAAISGSVELLKNELVLEGDYRKLMEIALDETQRLNNIITEFILYARPLPPNRRWVDLADLLSESVGLIRNAHPAKEIEIQIRPPSEPITLFVDPDQMKQVIWNLAINAFQAMPQGGTFTLMSNLLDGDGPQGNQVEICFCDTGSGIPLENRSKIFDPFFTTKSTGSGLGLPIVQRIIEQHGGTIRVESTPGKTTFRIVLPQGERESSLERAPLSNRQG